MCFRINTEHSIKTSHACVCTTPWKVCWQSRSVSPFFRDIGSTITSDRLQQCVSTSCETKNRNKNTSIINIILISLCDGYISISLILFNLYTHLRLFIHWKIVTLQVTSSSRDVIVELTVFSATVTYFVTSLLTHLMVCHFARKLQFVRHGSQKTQQDRLYKVLRYSLKGLLKPFQKGFKPKKKTSKSWKFEFF